MTTQADTGHQAKEEMLILLDGTAAMLRGMTMDPTIPRYAKEAMCNRILQLEAMVQKHLED